MDILISGVTGLVGSALRAALEARGDRVVGLGRSGEPSWDRANKRINGSIEGFDAVVHLAGESIGSGRMTAARQQEILDSRVETTRILVETLSACARKPSVLVSGSAIGYYGNRGREELLDEASTPGDDFLAKVAKEWEAAATPASEAGIRLALIRTGIVLTPDGGALKKMLIPFRLGVGGKLGNGRQYMSWITLNDEVRAIMHIIDTPTISGAVNLTAPHPVTNEVFSKLLGEALHRPAVLPVPSFALKVALGKDLATLLLLQGQRVFPKKLEANGFAFETVTIEAAFRSIFS
jgi:uncharacterized protein